ncbi:MAG: hypothetical protein IPN62_17385 [Flavobacteriales bacterium]|nr:hypothetical protein [Flavobacteriales bacterium]
MSSSPPTPAVVEVVDVARLKAKVFVSEHDATALNKARPVTNATDIYPGETFTGR